MTPLGIAIRLCACLLAVIFATWISAAVREYLDMIVLPPNELYLHRSVLMVTAAFIVLLATPFVPGAEIGLAMLTVFGAAIAPLVYAATVFALMLSYCIGRFVPPETVVSILRAIRLERAAKSVEQMAVLPPKDRLAKLMDGSTPRVLRLATRYRFIAIVCAINLPGNIVIGGGGGIALLAGLTGLFAPVPFLLTVAIAVLPLPLAIFWFGG